SPSTTYSPLLHAVDGLAVGSLDSRSAKFVGPYESTGVHVPGVPLVAPVAAGPEATPSPVSSGGATCVTNMRWWFVFVSGVSSGDGVPSASSMTSYGPTPHALPERVLRPVTEKVIAAFSIVKSPRAP